MLLPACSHKQTDATQQQEQTVQQQQAREERELHEREAALDEQQRLLEQREQGRLTVAPETTQPQPPAQAAPQPPAQPQEASGLAPDVTYQQFYDYLEPYGSWIQMAGYGYVWQPGATVRDNHWRPYTLGRWAYTDDGWTWISDEPFGWVTYHYGRWMLTHTEGWVWVPGDQWAPAWVAWRYGNDFVGWAPLPPEARFDGATGIQQWADQQYNLGPSDYIFVPASEFGDSSMTADEVPPDQVDPIYDESTNLTDIYESGGVIYCYGPNYEFLRGKYHGKFPPQMKLSRVAYNTTGTNGVLESNGTLRVTAPQVVPSRSAEEPKKVRDLGVVDARIISPASTPPPHGSEMPPLYRPPQVVKENAAREAQQQTAPPGGVAEPQDARGQTAQGEQRPGGETPQEQTPSNQPRDEAQREEQAATADRLARYQHAAEEAAARDARQQAGQQEAARQQGAVRQEEAARPVQAIPANGNAPAGPLIPGRQPQ
jgi:hypothetical protein